MLLHWILRTRFHRCYESSVRLTSGLGNNNDENAFLVFSLMLSVFKFDFILPFVIKFVFHH